MEPAPRIVLLTLYFPPLYSGAALQAVSLIRSLLGHGTEVTVLTAHPHPLPSPSSDEATTAGAQVVRMQAPRTIVARQLVLGLRASAWMLVHSRWDVLHIIGPTYAALLPACVARIRGRVVVTKTTLLAPVPGAARGRGLGALRLVRGWIYRLSDAVVALSEALENEVRRDAGEAPRVEKLPNGVDLDVFRRGTPEECGSLRRALGVAPDAFLIASCGEIHRRKRPGVLVEAASRMQRRPIHVILAGPSGNDREYELEIEEAIAKCPDHVAVTLMGTLAFNQVADLLRAADAFALTSASEGMPNSLLEAMASSLACVASDIPGSRDVLSHGGGRLVPLDDVDALAKVLDELADDPAMRHRLGSEARAVIAEHFSIDSVAERYLAVYRDLLATRRSRILRGRNVTSV